MNKSVTFDVIGEIKTKQRPRATVIGGHARVYPPKDTIVYENLIRTEYRRQCNDYNFGDKPLGVVIECFFKASKQLEEYGDKVKELPCKTNKDLDNICKLVDALNGIAWNDDKQIVDLSAIKHYTLGEEKISISIIDMSYNFKYQSIKDLQKEKRIEKLIERKQELLGKEKLKKSEAIRLEEIEKELKEYNE